MNSLFFASFLSEPEQAKENSVTKMSEAASLVEV